MYDSSESSQEPAGRWLLLIHQIPPKPDYFRVKVRRRLQGMGAVALKNSVYVLPLNDETTEDFQWLRQTIVDEGGEATVCAVTFLEGMPDADVEALFRAQADEEYGAIAAAARAADGTDAERTRLEKRLADARARDFFAAPGRADAERAVRALHAEAAAPPPVGREGRPHGATWVTRRGLFVDRMASAWLIGRFIDPDAGFRFVPASGHRHRDGELRFDMYEGEYTHEGDDCTFEVLLRRFALTDAALRAIADIVHDLDLKDDRFQRGETAGVGSMIRGIVARHDDDASRLAAGRELFDGLYAAFGGGA